MYNEVYIPRTLLIYPVGSGSVSLRVPTAVHDILYADLTTGWTYLKISQGDRTEVVKVVEVKDYGVLRVIRGVDNTDIHNFSGAAYIESVATAAAIADKYYTPTTLQALGGITIEGNVVGYSRLQFSILGATEIVGDGELGRRDDAYGCCDGNNEPALIPPIPFYLTSKPYPMEVVETLKSDASIRQRNRLVTRPLDLIQSTAEVLSGTIRTILKSYAYWLPDEIKNTASVLSGTIHQVLKNYGNWPLGASDESLKNDGSVLGGTIKVVLLTYTNWPHEDLKNDASILSGTLT